MNKKGQIHYLLLALVTLALSTATLYIFITFENTLNDQTEKIAPLATEIDFSENYVRAQATLLANETISSCKSCSLEPELRDRFKELASGAEERNRPKLAGNFYGQIRNDRFDFEQNSDGSLTLIIDSVFVEATKDYNKIKREFDIEVNLPRE